MKKISSTKDLRLSSNERLFLESKSIFDPKKYDNLKPTGLKIYVFHAGFKKKLNDLLVIIFDEPVSSSNFFSKTSTPSAPIIWDKKNNTGKVKALIVNSGNANAHTGEKGIEIIDKYVNSVSKILKCKKNEIVVSSTGVIGELFDPFLIINQVSKIKNTKTANLLDAAKSIMTTDTYPKIIVKNVKISNQKFKIYGIAKGSGMISPNMGTMLVYLFVEINISKNILRKIVKENLPNTFNSISVDTDTSTSDTLIIFSLNKKNINLNLKKNYTKLKLSIFELMSDLSQKIIKDGEGLTKLSIINVINAKNTNQAKNIAFSVANSPLVKTAISGEDANWGRIIMAIGKTNEKINQNKIEVSFGKNIVCRGGSIYEKINQSKLKKYMKNKQIEININLNNGNKSQTVYGNDLSHEYIRINADYRS